MELNFDELVEEKAPNTMAYTGPDVNTSVDTTTLTAPKVNEPTIATKEAPTPSAVPELDFDALTAEAPAQAAISQAAVPQQAVAVQPTPGPGTPKLAKDKDKGMTDYAIYHTQIGPAHQQFREEYISEFAHTPGGVTLDEAEVYAKEQVKAHYGVDDEWLANAKVPKPMVDKEKNMLLEDYKTLYTTGRYGKKAMDQALQAKGYTQRDIDQFTLKTDSTNLSMTEQIELEMAKGDDGALDNFAAVLTGIGSYFKQQYFSADAGYSPVAREMGETLLAESVASKIVSIVPGLAKFIGADWDMGEDALQYNKNIQELNKDSVGLMSKAAAEGPSLALESVTPVQWLTKAETAMQAIKMSTKAGVLGAGATAGSMTRDQVAVGEINRVETALWSSAILALPVVVSAGAALYTGGKILAPGQQAKLAWKYVQKTLTPEEMAKIDQMLLDMEKTGAFADATLEERKLVAATKLNHNLATDLAKEMANSIKGQINWVRHRQAIKGATGTKSATSEQAARLFDEISEQLETSATATAKAVTNELYAKSIPASDLTLPNNFEDLANDLPLLPSNLQSMVNRMIKGDRNDAITYQMIDDVKDGLFKYGTDTNNMQAKYLSEQLQITKDEIASTVMSVDDANRLINEAKKADVANKLLKNMFNSNVFGKMLKSAKLKGDFNLDPILRDNLDIGRIGKQLNDFLNALTPSQRKPAEEIIIDAFAQGFESSSEAARVLKIADFGGGGNGKELANSINVLRSATFKSPDAQAKLEMLELIARTSEFDGKINQAILSSPLGDIAAETGITTGMGWGPRFKLMIQPSMRFFAGRYIEGTAFRAQIKKILDESAYASKMLGKGPVNFEDAQAMQAKLFSTLYQAIHPSAYNKATGSGGINWSIEAPAQVKSFMKEYKEFNEFRDTQVNTIFFKKVDGKEIAPTDFNRMADALAGGRIAFSAGDIIPTGNADEFALALGSTVQFRNLGLLATGKPVPIRRILPREDNKELYAAYPGLSKLQIRGNSGMSPASQGALGRTDAGQVMAEVNPTMAAQTLHTIMGGKNLNALVTSTLHEIGHFLNTLEKLPAGTTPAYWSSKPLRNASKLAPKQGSISSNTIRAEQQYLNDVGEQMGRISGKQKNTIEGPDGVEYHTISYPKPKDMIPVPGKSANIVPGGAIELPDTIEGFSINKEEVQRLEKHSGILEDAMLLKVGKQGPVRAGTLDEDIGKTIDRHGDRVRRLSANVYDTTIPNKFDSAHDLDTKLKDAIYSYSENEYHAISKAQRAGKYDSDFDRLFIEHAPNFEGVVFNGGRAKGAQIQMFDSLKAGEYLTNKAFMATSTSRAVPATFMYDPLVSSAQRHGHTGYSGASIRPRDIYDTDEVAAPMSITLRTKQGYDVSHTTALSEDEVLIAPKSVFKILDKRIVGGVRHLLLEQVDPATAKGRPKNADMLGITGISTAGGALLLNKGKEQ